MYRKTTRIMRPPAATANPRRNHRSKVRHDSTGPPSPGPAELNETDLVTAAGAIDRPLLVRIAAQRARREAAAYAATGAPRPWRELLGEELRRTWSIARVLRECRQGRDALTQISPAELRIRELELQLHKLRHGLATPPGAKTRDDIAHCEALLARAREDEPAAAWQAADIGRGTGASRVPSPRSSDRNARDGGRSINDRAHQRKAARYRKHRRRHRRTERDARTERAGTRERRRVGGGAREGGYADADGVAIRLAYAQARLRALADRIKRVRAARRT
jgi:hypothetical protein